MRTKRIDAMAMFMVLDPGQYDVVVTVDGCEVLTDAPRDLVVGGVGQLVPQHGVAESRLRPVGPAALEPAPAQVVQLVLGRGAAALLAALARVPGLHVGLDVGAVRGAQLVERHRDR